MPVFCPVLDRAAGAPKLSGANRVRLRPGSRLAALYPREETQEEYFCNFEVNPRYVTQLESSGMRVAATGDNGEVRAVELPALRFFVVTLFLPQLSSTPEKPHPLIVSYLEAARGNKNRATAA